MEKTIKTFKTFNKVIQITALITSAGASIVSFIQGHNGEGMAWGCCVLWIGNLLMAENIINQKDALIEILKKELNK